MKKLFSIFCTLALFLPRVLLAYGPTGHQIVGAIADERLAHTPTGQQVTALLDGLTLEKASVIPDEIKGWDKKGADDPNIFHYSAHPKIDAQLRDFWRANQPTHDMDSAAPSHHWFHYTDVPVDHPEKYSDDGAGRSKWDIVHMIGYCVDVLQGRIPEENERKITKPVAIILLAHYVGDIHQPLHVGAEYFTDKGQAVDPAREKTALGDEGGNTVELRLTNDPLSGRLPHTKKLHGFWDLDTVNALLPEVPETMPKEQRYAIIDPAKEKLARAMAAEEPKDWKLPAGVEVRRSGEIWADEILPLAREAHERLTFNNVHALKQEDRVVAAGDAEEKPVKDAPGYKDWAAKVVRQELHKAGWRLADLLTQALAPAARAESSPKAVEAK
ncbi:MAG TPA: S1/P1 nuclease [Chthoniobacterales bacterium]|jgi:hypothetical protein